MAEGGSNVQAAEVGDELATRHLFEMGENAINGLNEASYSQLLVDTLSPNEYLEGLGFDSLLPAW